MIDIKLVRENPKILDEALKKRGLEPMSEELLNLDTEIRNFMLKTQKIQEERNKLSKEIGILRSKGENIETLLSKVSSSKEEQFKLEKELKDKKNELNYKLMFIPNILLEEVPFGKNENDNKVIRVVGEPKKFNFTPLEHNDLGVNLNMMDFEAAVKLSGSRFVVLRSDLAKLERALANFMIDVHTKEHGFIEHSVPVLVNEETLFGTSQLPKFYEDMFKTNYNDKWLISTAEIPLTNLVSDEILNEEDLPIRLTSHSLCFRSEAGAAGKDTKGMLRQHQFSKVEMVSIANPLNSEQELEYLVSCAENILKKLEIPYRVVLLCSGDTGFASSKTYDIEVWLPGQNVYREISSCSLCTDFQARRMKTRFKTKNSNKTSLVHTLNGSGLAVGRTLIAVLENYQNEDGSINIPKALIPYMGSDIIKI